MERRSATGVLGHRTSDGLVPFVVLACGTTWLLSLPLATAWLRGEPAPGYAFALAGLSAFGPTFAALAVTQRQGRARDVFARVRASPAWIAVALVTPLALHTIARLLEVALGGTVERWIWLPETSAQIAALAVFSVGEELGWRGFAHPVLARRHGLVVGPLITGAIWGVCASRVMAARP